MAVEKPATAASPPASAADIVADVDTGGRNPSGPTLRILLTLAILWSLFQLWIASPLPGMVGTIDLGFGAFNLSFNDTITRSVHLSFAAVLAFMAFPAFKGSSRRRVPVVDWVLGIALACAAMYPAIFADELAPRVGAPILQDVIVAFVGIVILLEATRRALGPPLMFVAIVFLLYAYFGRSMPGTLAHGGQDLPQMANHQWVTQEGVFGVALGVSTDFVFLFVLFGAMLDKAGAGHYFIQVAFSLLGHLRGGPAKAAVVSSGMTGLISGSSIANVVTTGTFTIPLMKRVGFSAEKAGAIEVAASTNGQLTPPVMGAAAFLMVEYTDTPYIDVVKHAFLPAIISYIALLYIVHLEAIKAGMQGLPRPGAPKPWLMRILNAFSVIVGIIVLAMAVYYLFGWMPGVFGAATPWISAAVVLAVYLGLLAYAATKPELEADEDPSAPILKLPEVRRVLPTGLHFLLPIVVLVYCLMVLRMSPSLSAFWATMLMIFISLTQRPILSVLRRSGDAAAAARQGFGDFVDGLISGARNMIGIGIAVSAAGIIVGVVTYTSVGLKLASVVEALSLGSLFIILLWTAVLCIVLGLGLPTTANYIVVSAIMAPIVVSLGQQNGLIVPLIAVHLFVFYFGILADDTPPVGLAAFAAAAVSGGDPIKTGIQGFMYDIRTAVLPFMFIFNTDLLLIDVTWMQGLYTFVVALIAILCFSAATQGWFFARNRLWETALLLLIALTLFRPGLWMDMIYPPFERHAPDRVMELVAKAPPGSDFRLQIKTETDDGEVFDTYVEFKMPEGATAEERLKKYGVVLVKEDGNYIVDELTPDSAAARNKHKALDEILGVLTPAYQPPKELFFLPGLALLAFLILLQRRRGAARLAPQPGAA